MDAHSTLCQVITCPICQELIGDEPKAMRMCGHTLCHQCYMVNSIRTNQMPCPVCRVASCVGNYGGVGNTGPIPVNQMLKDVYECVTERAEELKTVKCDHCHSSTGPFTCKQCVKSKEKDAERKARPKYLYEYDNCSVLESVTKKFQGGQQKYNESHPVEVIQVKEEKVKVKKEEQNVDSESGKKGQQNEAKKEAQSDDDCVIM